MDYTKFSEENAQSLLEMLACDDNYIFDCGVGCTYSADRDTFENLKRVLDVNLDTERLKSFEEGETFRLYVQQGECDIVHNAVKAITPEKGVLHAKVYVMKYKKVAHEGNTNVPDPYHYRVVVTSANLTKTNELNICAVFDSEDNGKDQDSVTEKNDINIDFGKNVSNFFKKEFSYAPLSEKIGKLLDELGEELGEELGRVEFGTSADFLDVVSGGVCKKMEEDARDGSAVIISPFLTGDFLKKFNAEKIKLVSRPDQMNACSNVIKEKGIECYTLGFPGEYDGNEDHKGGGNGEEGKFELPDLLHAKIFLIQQKDKLITYLGSANATASAFEKNIEGLVRYEEESKSELFPDLDNAEIYQKYEPEEQEQGDGNEIEFERKCREIISMFKATDNCYSVKKTEGYTYQLKTEDDWLDGKELSDEQEGEIGWNRTNRYPHCIKLRIKCDECDKEFPLLVDGSDDNKKIPILEDKIKRIFREELISKLFSKNRNKQGVSASGERNLKGNTESPFVAKQTPDFGLVERLSGLETEGEIRNVYKKCQLLKGKVGDEEVESILKAFCESCKLLEEAKIISLNEQWDEDKSNAGKQ